MQPVNSKGRGAGRRAVLQGAAAGFAAGSNVIGGFATIRAQSGHLVSWGI